ncbi:unnamed protein product [Protopolystoma xenopodis]|uniref:Uncharacterized protein n=1 Tax=Protopolystoma xenopodis TaxID=117903 RepID=A0A448XLN7_9PLAT|nr:unnamed protein product [Protopolystoma xenopodis]
MVVDLCEYVLGTPPCDPDESFPSFRSSSDRHRQSRPPCLTIIRHMFHLLQMKRQTGVIETEQLHPFLMTDLAMLPHVERRIEAAQRTVDEVEARLTSLLTEQRQIEANLERCRQEEKEYQERIQDDQHGLEKMQSKQSQLLKKVMDHKYCRPIVWHCFLGSAER